MVALQRNDHDPRQSKANEDDDNPDFKRRQQQQEQQRGQRPQVEEKDQQARAGDQEDLGRAAQRFFK